ncbi:MAG: MarR family transcriptional regulator [Bacteroidetes bacterium]|nr:MAG: MarR family transcriptional regulator [Bacteroidota bacterium]
MKLEDELKMKNFSSPHQKMLLNIIFTNYWIGDKMAGYMKSYDLSEQQYNVLRILRGQKGNPVNLKDLQERMMQKTSNVTRLVEKLRLKGLLERVQCMENRRKVEITITDKGLKLLEEMQPEMDAMNDRFAKVLTEEEASVLSDLLDKLRE